MEYSLCPISFSITRGVHVLHEHLKIKVRKTNSSSIETKISALEKCNFCRGRWSLPIFIAYIVLMLYLKPVDTIGNYSK